MREVSKYMHTMVACETIMYARAIPTWAQGYLRTVTIYS